jgi:hypothetical protein
MEYWDARKGNRNMTQPLPYATPAPPRSKHDTVYTVLLGVTTFFSLVLALVAWFLVYRAPISADSRWLMLWVCMMLLLAVVQGSVLLVRIFMPARRKWVTVTLNIILLLVVPWGTALGIYGLWKVDKGEVG